MKSAIDIVILLLFGAALLGLALGLMMLSDARDRKRLGDVWQTWLERVPAPTRGYSGRHRGSA